MGVRLNSSPSQLIEEGPTIDVVLGIDGRNIPGLPDGMSQIPLSALIDTGATGNSIDGRLAKSLRLPAVGTTFVSGVTGRNRHIVYLARLYVPSLAHPIYDRFTVAALSEGDQPQKVLLGRTFLANFSMLYIGQTGELVLDDKILTT